MWALFPSFYSCAFCEQEGHLAAPYPLLCASYPLHYFIFKGSLVDPRLRASNEGLLRPRVARAQETLSPSLRFHPFTHLEEWPDWPLLRASNEINVPSKLARYLSGMEAE